MNKRYKEVIRQLAEKGVNFDDLSERLNNFPESSSAKDIEDKLAKLINPQPQFTLTAEEVEKVRNILTRRMEEISEKSIDNLPLEEMDEWFDLNTFIAKIEQWQDEKRNES